MYMYEIFVYEYILLILLGKIIFEKLLESFKIEIERFIFILRFEIKFLFVYIVL